MTAAAAAGRRCGNGLQDEASSAHGAADLYAVLGLSRECTDAELRLAYRRLAMIWHPDRCSASGSSARVQEAKERFQEIQGAYSVLSDSNRRFLYDVGVYDSGDADLSGMGDFLGEMADMMSQATPTETFEELQQMFVDMFHDDLDAGLFGGLPPRAPAQQRGRQSQSSTSSVPPPPPLRPPGGRSNPQAPTSSSRGVDRRGGSTASASASAKRPRPGRAPDLGLSGFCFMVSESKQREASWACDGGDGRSGSKQRLSTSRDVSGAGAGTPRSRHSQSWGRTLWQ
ncbi:hypothetical protein BS78_10G073500 [Paspalum vaginatum]|nr:hypothetical protein BS78_10G073500 [Paspalum vaginatum]KAJ1258411.1 hypothetical protein BS78_10G073500 [Paspalum vaginatum]